MGGVDKDVPLGVRNRVSRTNFRKDILLTAIHSLLARMPRTRKSKGRVLPLQTPQAFTNRAYRLRLPNQIPASHPKNGSKAIKAEIVKNLAKGSLKTTEALSILDQDQIDRIRRANKGKFKENSRYIVNKNQAPTMCPEDIDFESEEAMPKAKRPCIRPHQTLEGEVQGPKDTALGSIYDDNKDAEWDFYDEITGTSPATDHHEQVNIPSNIGGSMSIQAQEDLVPLFATIEDQGLALIMDKTFASPGVVIQARRNGNQQTRQIGVYWYSPGIPRYEWPDGTVMESVVHGAFWNQIEAVEHVPGDTQLMSQDDRTNNGAPCFMQGNIPPAFDPMFNPLFDASSHQGYQGFPEQVPRTTAYPILQTPLSIPNYTGRYQTQSDSADEVWRDGYGSSGF